LTAVQVEVRPIEKLRGEGAIDVGHALSPVIDALCREDVDLANVRVVCDWIQYRNNFREPVVARPILDHGLEVAVDVRRAAEVDLGQATGAALHSNGTDRIHLEDWTPARSSCIWQFNALYWSALAAWEEATGQEYERTLPGGSSDARNLAGVHELIEDLFAVWDDLTARNALPDELYVLELGVGNGNQAKTWLEEFERLDRQHGSRYYRRLHYLMGDYSRHVLERAELAVAAHAEHVSSLVLDATRPSAALGFLRYKTFLVYISNVYDNLPTDEIARIGGRAFLVEVRAHLPAALADPIAERFSVPQGELVTLVHKLLRLGPEVLAEAFPATFPSVTDAVTFWVQVWGALRLEERFVPLPGLDLYEVAPGLSGEHVRPLLEANGDVRMHVSNGAVSSFAETIDLLHPFGRLKCHDLFVTSVEQYRTGFHGPGKYDGSVVNWVNGPLLQHVGRRRGFDVTLAPFGHRVGSKVSTLTAQVRD
jgi:hypothetical protein